MRFKHSLSTVALLSSLLGTFSFEAQAVLPFGSSQSNTQGSQLPLEDNEEGTSLEGFSETGGPGFGPNAPVSPQGSPLLPIGARTPQKAAAAASSSPTASRKAAQPQKGPSQAAKAQTEKSSPAARSSQRESSSEKPSHSYRTETPSFVTKATQRNASEPRVTRTSPPKQASAAPQMSPDEIVARRLLNTGGHALTSENITAVQKLVVLARKAGEDPAPFVPATVQLAKRRVDVTVDGIMGTKYLLEGLNAIADPSTPQIREMIEARDDGRVTDNDEVRYDARTLLAEDPTVPNQLPGNLQNTTLALRSPKLPIVNPTSDQIIKMSTALENGIIGWNWGDINAGNALLLEDIDLTGANVPLTRQGLIDLEAGNFIGPRDNATTFVFDENKAKVIALASNQGIPIDASIIDSILEIKDINIPAPTALQITDVRDNLALLRDPAGGIDDGTGGLNFDPADLNNVKAVTRVAALQDAVNQATIRDGALGLVPPDVDADHINAAKLISVEVPGLGLINPLGGQGKANIELFQKLERLNQNGEAPGAALHSRTGIPLSELWTLRGGAFDTTTALTALVRNANGAPAKAAVKDNYYTTVLNATKSLLRIEPNGLNAAQLLADHGIRLQEAEDLEAHLLALAALASAEADARQENLRQHARAVHLFITTVKSNPPAH